MKKILSFAWFQNGGYYQGHIAIVITSNNYGEEKKAYIGTYDPKWSERESLVYVAEWGGKFDLEIAEIIIERKGFKREITIPKY